MTALALCSPGKDSELSLVMLYAPKSAGKDVLVMG